MHTILNSGTFVFLVITLFIQCGTLAFLYIADKRLKFLAESGIEIRSKLGVKKQVRVFILERYKYLFVYYKRKESIITKHAFLCMIAYYIINIVGFAVLTHQFVMGNSSFIVGAIFCFLNLGLMIAVQQQPALNYEKGQMLNEYMSKEREKRKEKKENG